MVGGTGKNAINKLGEAQIQAFIRKAEAGKAQKPKLADGGGMYLKITSAGAPVWRLKYRPLRDPAVVFAFDIVSLRGRTCGSCHS